MRMKINKIVAFAIGISVMSGSIMPVFAADNAQNIYVQNITNQKQAFTLEDAIKAAISNSETLVLDIKKINYQNNVNDTNEELDDFNNIDGDQEDFNNDIRDITLKQLKQQKDFDEDVLIQKTTKAYNDIVTSKMKIDKAEKELEIKNKELDYTKFKESLGMITSTDLKSTELEIEKLLNTQKLSESTLKDSQDSFKVLTHIDITKYSLEQDIEYETLKINNSINEYLDDVIDKYLKYTEQIIKLKKDYYNDSDNKVTAGDVDNAKDISENAIEPKRSDYQTDEEYENAKKQYEEDIKVYTTAISARLTYLSNNLSVAENGTSLNESKKQFKEQLRTSYTKLLASEDSINYLKKSISVNNKIISDGKLKYDLGMITESNYNTQVVNSEDLDLQLRSEIDNYNTLKEEIQKPWIAFS